MKFYALFLVAVAMMSAFYVEGNPVVNEPQATDQPNAADDVIEAGKPGGADEADESDEADGDEADETDEADEIDDSPDTEDLADAVSQFVLFVPLEFVYHIHNQ